MLVTSPCKELVDTLVQPGDHDVLDADAVLGLRHRVDEQMDKWQSPTPSFVDWGVVVTCGCALLRGPRKDILVACYVATAWLRLGDPAALTHGFTLLAGLLKNFGEHLTATPRQHRAVRNALQWYLDRIEADMAAQPMDAWRDSFDAFASAAQVFFPPEQLKIAPRQRRSDGEQDARSHVSPQQSGEQHVTAAAAPPQSQAPVPRMPTCVDEVPAALRQAGEVLLQAARILRLHDLGDANAYRLARQGLWMHVVSEPDNREGKTRIAPLPRLLQGRIEALAAEAKHKEVVDAVEAALLSNRLHLDLNHTVATALDAQGLHAAAEAVRFELAALLTRLPALEHLQANDGNALLSPKVRCWVFSGNEKDESASQQWRVPERAAVVDEGACPIRLRREGNAAQVLALHATSLDACKSGLERFRLRCEMAQFLASTAKGDLAETFCRILYRQAKEEKLQNWDGALFATCIDTYLGCLRRRGAKAQNELSAILLEELMQLDPVAAAKFF